jgi:hypothetical protein
VQRLHHDRAGAVQLLRERNEQETARNLHVQPRLRNPKETSMNPILDAAMHTTDNLKGAASRTRGSFLELGVQSLKLLNTVRAQEVRTLDIALGRIGLQRRENPLRPVALFFVGAAIAGGAALLLAPTSGRKARRKIRELFGATDTKQTLKSVIEVQSALDPKADGAHVSDGATPTTAKDHSHGH